MVNKKLMVVGDHNPRVYNEFRGYFKALEDEGIVSDIIVGNSSCFGEIHINHSSPKPY